MPFILEIKDNIYVNIPLMIFFCSHYHCEDQRLIFPILELQSKWAALVISGKILLPSEDDMLAEVHEHYRELDENGFPNFTQG